MPALVPAVQPWAAFGGTYTLSTDLETMTIGASPAETVRTPWYDMGSGSTLAKILWDGTASGTIRGRSSYTRPDRTDDLAPVQPADSEWAYKYDASLGTAPTSQGWSKSGSITETLSGGSLRMQSAGAAYYYINPGALLSQSDDMLVIRFSGLKLNSGHAGNFQLLHINGSKSHSLLWTGSAYGSDTNKLSIGGLAYAPGFAATADTKFDYMLVVRRTSGTNTDARVFIKATGSDDRYELAGMVDFGPMPTPNDSQTFIIFGALSGSGFDVSVDHIGAYSGTEWETVTDGDTSFTTNRRYWQAKGWSNGTLTELDLQSDLSAPGNPATPQAGAVGASAIGGNCTSTASGAAAYFVECLDADNADAVVADRWELEPCATFRGLTVPGNFKVRFTSASDDGVRGSASVTTSSTPVPAPASGTTGNTAPVIAIDVAVTNPRILIGYQGGAMRIYYSATQPTSFTVYVSTDGGSSYAVDTGQPASGVITVSSLSYNGSTPGTSYATNHGLTLVAGRRYYLIPTYSDGSIGRPTNVIYPNDDADWECVVSGRVSTDLNGLMVAVRLTEAAKSSAKTWRSTINPAKIIAGQWSVTVPRTAKSGVTALDGVGTVKVIFELPNQLPVQATVPDQASALFEDLTLSAV